MSEFLGFLRLWILCVVGSSKPTATVLCPWARHFTPRKYWLITQEAVAPSRHDWKIVDWDVKPQHKQNHDVQDLLFSHLQMKGGRFYYIVVDWSQRRPPLVLLLREMHYWKIDITTWIRNEISPRICRDLHDYCENEWVENSGCCFKHEFSWCLEKLFFLNNDLWAQRRLRSACTSAQSDQSLRCLYEAT